jgi:hypothetical protein
MLISILLELYCDIFVTVLQKCKIGVAGRGLGQLRNSKGTCRVRRNVFVGNALADRGSRRSDRFPPMWFLPIMAELSRRASFLGSHGGEELSYGRIRNESGWDHPGSASQCSVSDVSRRWQRLPSPTSPPQPRAGTTSIRSNLRGQLIVQPAPNDRSQSSSALVPEISLNLWCAY